MNGRTAKKSYYFPTVLVLVCTAAFLSAAFLFSDNAFAADSGADKCKLVVNRKIDRQLDKQQKYIDYVCQNRLPMITRELNGCRHFEDGMKASILKTVDDVRTTCRLMHKSIAKGREDVCRKYSEISEKAKEKLQAFQQLDMSEANDKGVRELADTNRQLAKEARENIGGATKKMIRNIDLSRKILRDHYAKNYKAQRTAVYNSKYRDRSCRRAPDAYTTAAWYKKDLEDRARKVSKALKRYKKELEENVAKPLEETAEKLDQVADRLQSTQSEEKIAAEEKPADTAVAAGDKQPGDRAKQDPAAVLRAEKEKSEEERLAAEIAPEKVKTKNVSESIAQGDRETRKNDLLANLPTAENDQPAGEKAPAETRASDPAQEQAKPVAESTDKSELADSKKDPVKPVDDTEIVANAEKEKKQRTWAEWYQQQKQGVAEFFGFGGESQEKPATDSDKAGVPAAKAEPVVADTGAPETENPPADVAAKTPADEAAKAAKENVVAEKSPVTRPESVQVQPVPETEIYRKPAAASDRPEAVKQPEAIVVLPEKRKDQEEPVRNEEIRGDAGKFAMLPPEQALRKDRGDSQNPPLPVQAETARGDEERAKAAKPNEVAAVPPLPEKAGPAREERARAVAATKADEPVASERPVEQVAAVEKPKSKDDYLELLDQKERKWGSLDSYRHYKDVKGTEYQRYLLDKLKNNKFDVGFKEQLPEIKAKALDVFGDDQKRRTQLAMALEQQETDHQMREAGIGGIPKSKHKLSWKKTIGTTDRSFMIADMGIATQMRIYPYGKDGKGSKPAFEASPLFHGRNKVIGYETRTMYSHSRNATSVNLDGPKKTVRAPIYSYAKANLSRSRGGDYSTAAGNFQMVHYEQRRNTSRKAYASKWGTYDPQTGRKSSYAPVLYWVPTSGKYNRGATYWGRETIAHGYSYGLRRDGARGWGTGGSGRSQVSPVVMNGTIGCISTRRSGFYNNSMVGTRFTVF